MELIKKTEEILSPMRLYGNLFCIYCTLVFMGSFFYQYEGEEHNVK